MRLFGRLDALLPVGLTLAGLVVFQRPIRNLLEWAHAVEETYGLALVPGLLILAVVFLFHYQSKRHEHSARAAAAAEGARHAQEREGELEQLVAFGQELAEASDTVTLHEAIRRHLPRFVGDRTVWALVRTGGKWEALAGGGTQAGSDRASPALESLADSVLKRQVGLLHATEGTECDGYICFPLIVGEAAVGLLGVARGPDSSSDSWRRTVASAAALLAIAVRNVQLIREIQEHGVYDGLTGCFNRTHAMKVLEAELQRATRAGSPLALVMLDLDHFKSVNDQHGHLCGDAVLGAVGRRMREVLRNSDVKCRYGGEEFLVMLPDTPLNGAVHVAESLREEIGNTSVLWSSESVSSTASLGVAVSMSGELDSRTLIARADAALYQAKHEGRNRVCVEAPAAQAPEAELPTSPDPHLS